MNAVMDVYFGIYDKDGICRPLTKDLLEPASDTDIIEGRYELYQIYLEGKAYQKLKENVVPDLIVKNLYLDDFKSGPTTNMRLFIKVLTNSGYYDNVDKKTQKILSDLSIRPNATATVLIPRG